MEANEAQGVPADFALGLHVPGRFDKVLDVNECPIVFEEGERILNSARALGAIWMGSVMPALLSLESGSRSSAKSAAPNSRSNS